MAELGRYEQVSLNILERQFGYTNVAALMMKRAEVYDTLIGDIITDLMGQFFDIRTCTAQALDNYWGKLLNISRVFEDEDGNKYTLTDAEFREVIQIKLFSWDGTLASLNEFFRGLFAGRGSFFGVDLQDMTYIRFIIGFALTDNEKALFDKFDILPRPAGIGARVKIITSDKKYFGFGRYESYTESPITVGFGTYNGEPLGAGQFATYNDEV